MYPHFRFIQSYVPHRCVGVLVEFGLETRPEPDYDRPEFLTLAQNLTVHVSDSNPQSVDALLQQPYFSNLLQQAYLSDPAVTVAETLANTSARLRQKISVTRFVRWSNEPQPGAEPEVSTKNRPVTVRRACRERVALVAARSSDHTYPQLRFIQSYDPSFVHPLPWRAQGLVGVLVEFGLETWRVTERPEFLELSRYLALHIADTNPKSLGALLQQRIGKGGRDTVEKLIAGFSQDLCERISIARFVRWGDWSETAVPPKDPAVAVRLRRA